jgi:hypothetical protein
MFTGVIDFIMDMKDIAGKPNYTVLVLGEYLDIPLLPGVNVTQASILLPPYTAAAMQLDGDLMIFKQEYYNYLQSPDVRRYFAVLLLGLLQGRNYALYVQKDEAELPFTTTLLSFLQDIYGIMPGITDHLGYIPCQYLENCNPPMLLYENNLINGNMFLNMFPRFMPIPIPFVQKLIIEYRMNYPQWTIYDYSNYFNTLKDGTAIPIKIVSPIVEIGDN